MSTKRKSSRDYRARVESLSASNSKVSNGKTKEIDDDDDDDDDDDGNDGFNEDREHYRSSYERCLTRDTAS